MLIHHSGQDYNVAASEAANEARTKFESRLDAGKAAALKVFEQIFTQVPQDRIVKSSALKFEPTGDAKAPKLGVIINGQDGTVVETFHRNAIGQAASRVDLPLNYADTLTAKGDWGVELLAENFNKLFAHNNAKHLTRSVNQQVRGFLSDSFRRMDSRPIVESFAKTMQTLGAIPIDGYAMETKIAIKAVLPMVFEPVKNEVMIYGIVLENSDFGNGALSMRTFVERLWCTNRAIANEELRKIHLGARLHENLQLSQRTYDLDTATMASAVEDITQKALGPGAVNEYMALIEQANAEGLDAYKAKEFLKKNLNKGEADAVLEAFNSPEVEMLPAGNTTWRMSNAISWIANTKVEDEERKLVVMKAAGAILGDLKAA